MLAFTGPPDSAAVAQGNPCLVVPSEYLPGTPPVASGITRCATWPVGPLRAGVQCWGPSGEKIQCCGHGLLSCAALWQQQWGEPGVLVAGAQEVPCNVEQGINWLAFPTLATEPLDVPGWAEDTLGLRPQRAAIAGPDDGYLILEATAGASLQEANPPGDALATHTRRALILTCRTANSSSGEDIHYRYFAPQYGSAEDIATGSAMRVLAPYWNARGQGPELSALQCSAEGGWLYSHLEGGITWIGGHVAQDSCKETA